MTTGSSPDSGWTAALPLPYRGLGRAAVSPCTWIVAAALPGNCGPSTAQTQERAAQLMRQGWVLVAKSGRIEVIHKP